MRIDRCKSCRAEIVWIRTEAGKFAPCDAQVLTIFTDDGKCVRGRQSHHAKCPAADAHRKTKDVSNGATVRP